MFKKILIPALSLFSFNLFAQYTTPNSGTSWTLDSLVANSGGVVTGSGTNFTITGNLTISRTDTLIIGQNSLVGMNLDVEVTVLGSMVVAPPDSVRFQQATTGQFFTGFTMDSSRYVYWNKVVHEGGRATRILDCSPTFENCIFRLNQRRGTATVNQINLFRSNPLIKNCLFYRNAGPAIGGGANIANAPKIYNCQFIENNTQNDNRPQINLGSTGTSDTAKIIGCTVTGGPYIMAGGIAFSPIGTTNLCIDSNLIENNRYGIACGNGPVGGYIRHNTIVGNNIQNNANQGGSGLNFNGGSTNRVIVTGNYIEGNLWGITIQATAKPNIGDLRGDTSNIGMNIFVNNVNAGAIYQLYNNTPDSIWAQNNFWGSTNLDTVEAYITHNPDIASLGFVTYLPIWDTAAVMGFPAELTSQNEVQIYPNPVLETVHIRSADESTLGNILLFDNQGRLVLSHGAILKKEAELSFSHLPSGIYYLRLERKGTQKYYKLLKN